MMRKKGKKFSSFSYPYKRIQHLDSLAKSLAMPVQTLIELSQNASNMFIPQKKDDTKKRDLYSAKPQLKKVLIRINEIFLKKVKYPDFIHNVKGRSYITNARIHTDSKVIFKEDIKNFFPSTQKGLILKVWKDFFCFSHEVAECLTNLTTKDGFLPQGAETSTYLASLFFFDIEPKLYMNFSQQGLDYTRYVDDITVSSKLKVSNNLKSKIKQKIYGMMKSKGYKPKRSKSRIVHDCDRQDVTGCVVNSKLPTKQKSKIKNVRAAVKQLEMYENKASNSYKKQHCSVQGRIYEILRLKPNSKIVKELLSRIKNISPISVIGDQSNADVIVE